MSKHLSTITPCAGAKASQPATAQTQTTKPKRTPEERAKFAVAAKLRRAEKLNEARRTLGAANEESLAVKWLRVEDLEIYLKRSRASIYRDVISGHLPSPERWSERCVRWKLADVDAALAGARPRKSI